MLEFRTPNPPVIPPPVKPPLILGDCGITAGSGIDGDGETDRRTDGVVEPKDDRLLCEVGGGFMGNANEFGVPGAEGIGDPIAAAAPSLTN